VAWPHNTLVLNKKVSGCLQYCFRAVAHHVKSLHFVKTSCNCREINQFTHLQRPCREEDNGETSLGERLEGGGMGVDNSQDAAVSVVKINGQILQLLQNIAIASLSTETLQLKEDP
jgi:hypothetical protein